METINLKQLNLEMASGLLKVLSGYLNDSSSVLRIQEACMGIIPKVLDNALTDFTSFNGSVNIPSAVFYMTIDAIIPPDNLENLTPPTTNNNTITKVIIALFERLKTISPEKAQMGAENSRVFFVNLATRFVFEYRPS